MAKIRIHVTGKEPVWFQFDNQDSLGSYLFRCGYAAEEIQALTNWALSPQFGAYTALPRAEVCKERGNVETWDNLTGQWVSSPLEMESFLAEIRSVCGKYGLTLCAEGEKELLVQAYCEEAISRIDGAVKDYEDSEIRKQAQNEEPEKRWEYRSVYIGIDLPVGADMDSLVPGYTGTEMVTGGKTHCWQACLEKELNKLGAEGWELVAIQTGMAYGRGEDGYALFKRPVRQ